MSLHFFFFLTIIEHKIDLSTCSYSTRVYFIKSIWRLLLLLLLLLLSHHGGSGFSLHLSLRLDNAV